MTRQNTKQDVKSVCPIKNLLVLLCSVSSPVVLSSDDEEEEADNASTGSVNRLDSVSPRPADSAHSSPAPSGGRVEAAVKSAGEQQEELNTEFFEDVNMKITLPRRARMKDQVRLRPGPEPGGPD